MFAKLFGGSPLASPLKLSTQNRNNPLAGVSGISSPQLFHDLGRNALTSIFARSLEFGSQVSFSVIGGLDWRELGANVASCRKWEATPQVKASMKKGSLIFA